MSKRRFAGLIAISALAFAGVTSAKTLYVDQTRINLSSTCSKADPCTSIQNALDIATPNSRIIVSPGRYSGNLVFDIQGLRITSVAGARGTVIALGAGNGITISADKVHFGQKGKGFRLTGDPVGNDVVFVTGSQVRFEGNIVDLDDGAIADDALANNGSRATIRYNEFSGTTYGLYMPDVAASEKLVFTDNVTSSMANFCLYMNAAENSGARIQDNHFLGCGSQCVIINTDGRDRSRIRENLMENWGERGIRYDYAGVAGGDTGNTIERNVIEKTGTGFAAIEQTGGNPVIKRNAVIGPESGTDIGILLTNTDGAKVTENLVQGFMYPYAHSTTTVDTTFNNNHVDKDVFIGAAAPAFKQFKNNNLSFCGLFFEDSVPSDPTIAISKNYYHGSFPGSGPQFSHCSGANGVYTAFSDGRLLVNPASRPNSVKFKGGL